MDFVWVCVGMIVVLGVIAAVANKFDKSKDVIENVEFPEQVIYKATRKPTKKELEDNPELNSDTECILIKNPYVIVDPATDGFKEYRMGLASEKFDRLINCVDSLNAAITADESLGEGFCIGHSYFCNLKKATNQALARIVEFELIPLLREYWFDEPLKVKDWTHNLRSAIK